MEDAPESFWDEMFSSALGLLFRNQNSASKRSICVTLFWDYDYNVISNAKKNKNAYVEYEAHQ